MWLHPGRLEHLLPPRAYVEPQQHAREAARLFRRSWQLVGLASDLAREGAEVATVVAGVHIHVARRDGVLVASGAEGPAQRPGPWRALQLATAGALVFVALDPDLPPLERWLDHATLAAARAAVTPSHRVAWRETLRHPCNWKVALENVLETYHVPVLHQNALARRPELFQLFTGTPPGRDTHTIDRSSTTYVDSMGADSPRYRWIAGHLRPGFDATYVHHHAVPNLIVAWNHLVTFLQVVLPTSATTSESRVCLLLWEGEASTRAARIAVPLLRGIARRAAPAFMSRVLAEDGAIHASVQRGLAASPYRGVLSAREERVHAFQRFVRDACDG